jgi:hypothetical protein
MPSSDAPISGRCACGTVEFEVSAPFETACYCHCKRCQRRTGVLWSVNAMAPKDAHRFLRGEDNVRVWDPGDGLPKAFCATCGGHLYSDGGDSVWVRLGTLDADPGIRPEWHQWLESAPAWGTIPDDGLPRFPQGRTS